jgi:hypothetical protein
MLNYISYIITLYSRYFDKYILKALVISLTMVYMTRNVLSHVPKSFLHIFSVILPTFYQHLLVYPQSSAYFH